MEALELREISTLEGALKILQISADTLNRYPKTQNLENDNGRGGGLGEGRIQTHKHTEPWLLFTLALLECFQDK